MPGELDDIAGRVDRMRAGKAAQRELYELFRPELVARIARELPPFLRPRLDAEDVYQEAFLRAIESLDRGFTWQGEDSFRGYIFTIARHSIATTARRRSAAQVRLDVGIDDSQATGGSPPSPCAPDASISEILANRDEFEHVISCLTAHELEVFRLRTVEGLGYTELGERIDKTAEAARKVFSRAEAKLLERVRARKGDNPGPA